MASALDSVLLPITVGSPSSLTHYNQAVEDFLGWSADFTPHLVEALEADPNFTMVHVLAGTLEAMGGVDSAHIKMARDSITSATTARERLHVDAMVAWSEGRMRNAASIWEQILEQHPTDVLALKFATDNYFFLGDSLNLRQCPARVFSAYQNKLANTTTLGHVKGIYAFGLEETGDYAEAERLGRESFDRVPNDAWAAHAVAHVCEMQGRVADGADWLDSTSRHWMTSPYLARHNHWHNALFRMETERFDEVWSIYDRHIRGNNLTLLDLVDISSLLFRLQLAGQETGERWAEVIEAWKPHVAGHLLTFNDVHMMMCAVGAPDPDFGEHVLGSMRTYTSQHGSSTVRDQGPIAVNVGLQLAEIIKQWGEKQYDVVVDKLVAIEGKIQSIGGSHAQRGVFTQLLLHAALHGTRPDKAVQVTVEHRARRHDAPQSLKQHAAALAFAGDVSGRDRLMKTYEECLRRSTPAQAQSAV